VLQGDSSGTVLMAASNYLEGWLNPEGNRLELPAAGHSLAIGPGQLIVEIGFSGFILRRRGERSIRGTVGGHQHSLAEAAVLTQVDEQEQHHKEHDYTFHRGLSLWVDVLFLRLWQA
jgi:hypothetical protein